MSWKPTLNAKKKDIQQDGPNAQTSGNSVQIAAPAVAANNSLAARPSASGLLVIRVCEARSIPVPPGVNAPDPPKPLPTSATAQQIQQQRKACWWLPYAILEFDKNEIMIDAMGGDVVNPVWQYRASFDVSRDSEAIISLYLRTGPPDPKANSDEDVPTTTASRHQHNTQHPITRRPSKHGDAYIGSVRVRPEFSDNKIIDQWYHLVTPKSTPSSPSPIKGGTPQKGVPAVHLQLVFKRDREQVSLSIDSFDLLKVIGKGSFGKVMQVRKRDTNRIYAMKIIRKQHIITRAEVHHTLAERTVLARLNNPFIVPLKFSFQSPEKLYLVLAFVNGGELFHHLQTEGRFDEQRSRFYIAELLCALECLHGFNVVYRDLKPENILLDYTGHIALCDFGLCKLNMTDSETTNTFCGTPEYLAPELLLSQGYTKTVDWWTLGVLLYEMLTGLPPFYDQNTNDMYVKILQDELKFTEEISPLARSLLEGLLNRDPNHRLGNNGAEEIKAHPFFAEINWKQLMAKKVAPPFKPSVRSAVDTSNFDDEFTSEAPTDSVVADSHLSETAQNQFAGFTYDAGKEGAIGQSMGTSYIMGRSMGGQRG